LFAACLPPGIDLGNCLQRTNPLSKRISVLVIDDEELVRRVLQRSLTLYGFKVHLASNGRTGVKLAQQNKPEFILLDWMMPEMDGLEILS
jgi:CheY-like chemotaxis protein